MRLEGLHLDNSSGGGRFRGVDFSVRGGSVDMNFNNFSEDNVTHSLMNLSITNASVIDLSLKNKYMTSETFCIGSFSTDLRLHDSIREEEA